MFFVTSDFLARCRSGESIEGGATVASLPNGQVRQATEPVIETSPARCSIFFPNEGTPFAVQACPSPLRDRNFSAALRTDSYFVPSSRHHRPTRVKGCHAGIVPALGQADGAGTPQN
jgi:hypothetical protein